MFISQGDKFAYAQMQGKLDLEPLLYQLTKDFQNLFYRLHDLVPTILQFCIWDFQEKRMQFKHTSSHFTNWKKVPKFVALDSKKKLCSKNIYASIPKILCANYQLRDCVFQTPKLYQKFNLANGYNRTHKMGPKLELSCGKHPQFARFIQDLENSFFHLGKNFAFKSKRSANPIRTLSSIKSRFNDNTLSFRINMERTEIFDQDKKKYNFQEAQHLFKPGTHMIVLLKLQYVMSAFVGPQIFIKWLPLQILLFPPLNFKKFAIINE